eukprot:scaffold4824_cov383-Prasinococcus_capsulatus_cf.AAC.1
MGTSSASRTRHRRPGCFAELGTSGGPAVGARKTSRRGKSSECSAQLPPGRDAARSGHTGSGRRAVLNSCSSQTSSDEAVVHPPASAGGACLAAAVYSRAAHHHLPSNVAAGLPRDPGAMGRVVRTRPAAADVRFLLPLLADGREHATSPAGVEAAHREGQREMAKAGTRHGDCALAQRSPREDVAHLAGALAIAPDRAPSPGAAVQSSPQGCPDAPVGTLLPGLQAADSTFGHGVPAATQRRRFASELERERRPRVPGAGADLHGSKGHEYCATRRAEAVEGFAAP